MNANDFRDKITKLLLSEISRLFLNKNRTVSKYSIVKDEHKNTLKVTFSLPAPYSKESDILILVRDNGNISKWVNLIDNEKPIKLEDLTLEKLGANNVNIGDSEVKVIARQLLKEIDG